MREWKISLDRMLDRVERYLKMLSDGTNSRDAVRDERTGGRDGSI